MNRSLHLLTFAALALSTSACSSSSDPSSASDAAVGGGGAAGANAAGGASGSVGGSSAMSGPGPTVSGCPVFPPTSEWNRDISADPVDPMSATYMASMNAGSKKLHPDFGSDPSYGIPYVVVPDSTPKVPMTFQYADESDPGPYPFPPNAPIEQGDMHVLVVDSGTCTLYETYNSVFVGPGWTADSGAVFNLQSDALRMDGWTSADAAGLPIFPGLARRDETTAGEILHALRFTVSKSQNAFVHPATHEAGSNDPSLPPMGLRVRLQASYDLSKVTGASLVILTALKKYGMFVADNGSDWYISGATDTGWDDDDLSQIKDVPASAFEVVQLGPLLHDAN